MTREEELQEIRTLAGRLFEAKVDRESAELVSSMVKTTELRKQLLQWMDKNRTAEEKDIVAEAHRLMVQNISWKKSAIM